MKFNAEIILDRLKQFITDFRAKTITKGWLAAFGYVLAFMVSLMIDIPGITLVLICVLYLALLAISCRALYKHRTVPGLASVLVLILVLAFTVSQMMRDTVILNSFSVPEEFSRDNPGYTREIVIKKLVERVNSTYRFRDSVESRNITRKITYDVPGVNVSLEFNLMGITKISIDDIGLHNPFNYVKRHGYAVFFNYLYLCIDGEITRNKDDGDWKLTLHLKKSGDGLPETKSFDWRNEKAITEAAELIISAINPFAAFEYYLKLGDYKQATDIGIGLFRNNLCASEAPSVGEFRNKTRNDKFVRNLAVTFAMDDKPGLGADIITRYREQIHDAGYAGVLLGCLYMLDNRYDDAVKELESALKTAGDNPRLISRINSYRGQIFYIKDMKPEAEECFRKAIEGNASNATPYYFLGLMRYGKREYTEALVYFKKSLEYKYANPELYYYLGFTYKMLGDDDKKQYFLMKFINEMDTGGSRVRNADLYKQTIKEDMLKWIKRSA